MAHRELELTLLSARDLKNVNLFTRMDVYAVASISGDPMTRQSTPTDTSGGRNPSWNTTLRFNLPPSAAAANGGWLHVLLRSERALGDRDIGEVVIPLAEILAGADGMGPQPPRLASYQVHTVLRGEPRGVLNVSYRLGPIVAPVERPGEKPAAVGYPVAQNLAPPQPYKPPNPTLRQPPYQYNPPHGAQNPPPPPPPYKPPNPAPPQPQYQYSPPQYAHQRQPRHEALSPTNYRSYGHGPPPVYGPQTQIIFASGGGARSNSIPTAKEDRPERPKPSYTPAQPKETIPAKEHGSKPKSFYTPPQSNPRSEKANYYDSNGPNASPRKLHRPQQETKVGEQAHTQPKMGSGKTDHSIRIRTQQALQPQDSKADSTRPREAYASNSAPPGKAADRQSGHKPAMQHERLSSLPTAAAR